MPEIHCDLTECQFNEEGTCGNDFPVELDSTATCQSYEQKRA